MLNKVKTDFTFFIIIILSIFLIGLKMHRDEQHRLQSEQMAVEVQKLVNRTVKVINPEHLKCLAANIYHEAGSEPFMGQVAVARVVMNRIKYGFGTNPCRVVYQSNNVPDLDNPDGVRKVCQFSWVCEGKSMLVNRNARYMQAEEIARKVLSEDKWREVIPSNVLFFHNSTVDPRWAYRKVVTIGNHVFYSKSTHKEKN